MFFHEYFDGDFSVFDESGTYSYRESYDLDPKLNLTLTALLRKVPILYRIRKDIQSVAHVRKRNIPHDKG